MKDPAEFHCQNGHADICLAARRDGITCPHDSCNIDEGVVTLDHTKNFHRDPLILSLWSISLVNEADEQIKAGNQSGNFALVTSARLRRVVAMMDVEDVRAELLAGMGIAAEVSPLEEGIMIEVLTPHSLQTIMNALRSTFDVLGAMGRNGRMAVKVMIPNELKISS